MTFSILFFLLAEINRIGLLSVKDISNGISDPQLKLSMVKIETLVFSFRISLLFLYAQLRLECDAPDTADKYLLNSSISVHSL